MLPERLFPDKFPGRWWLYLVGRRELNGSANWVKVGITSSPRSRLRDHRRRGSEWLHLMSAGSRTFAYQTERLICERFRVIGAHPYRRNREDFFGIEKTAAIGIARAVIGFVRDDLEQWTPLDLSRKAENKAWHAFRQSLSDALSEQG